MSNEGRPEDEKLYYTCPYCGYNKCERDDVRCPLCDALLLSEGTLNGEEAEEIYGGEMSTVDTFPTAQKKAEENWRKRGATGGKIFVLDTQIYGIHCYLGEVVDFKQIRAGKASSSDTPVIMFQKIRFLDEEMGKYLSLYTFGQHEEDNETLIDALKTRDDLRDVFCPTDRCITVLRNSRTGKAVKPSDIVANMLEKYDYLQKEMVERMVLTS